MGKMEATTKMEVILNSRQEGKNYKQFKEFIVNLEKAKIGSGIGIVTKNKTIFLIKEKEQKHKMFKPD